MPTSSSFTFPVVSFRNLDTPFQKQGYRDYFAVVDVGQLPDLSDWRQINVRDPKLTGSVPKAIRESFRDKADMFVFMNRGIVLSVDQVSFDNKASTVTIKLTNPHQHGLLDGGHTYNIVMEEVQSISESQYIRIEFLEGFEHNEIIDVVDARNTSNQVREQSLMNLAGEFEALKKALKGTPYLDLISFKEYEFDEDGNPRPIDVREVVAILTLFDRDNFNESSHPIMAYNSKAACLKHFQQHTKSFRKMYAIAPDLLALYDHVREQLPLQYNRSGGKFGRLTGVTYYKNKKSQRLYFIDKETKYGVPDGFTYPIVSAFRALLEEKDGRYVWGKHSDPVELLKGDLGQKLADTIGNFAVGTQNPSKTGKSPLVWQTCYQSVLVAYLRSQM